MWGQTHIPKRVLKIWSMGQLLYSSKVIPNYPIGLEKGQSKAFENVRMENENDNK